MLVDMESVKEFDVRLFVREEYGVLKQRRVERHGYVSSSCWALSGYAGGLELTSSRSLSSCSTRRVSASRELVESGSDARLVADISPI
jgi:hypothetical protein